MRTILHQRPCEAAAVSALVAKEKEENVVAVSGKYLKAHPVGYGYQISRLYTLFSITAGLL